MKKVIAALCLTAALVSPALAQSRFVANSGHYVNGQIPIYPAQADSAWAAQASAGTSSKAAIVDGQVVGHDPDVNVRLQLERDANSWNG